MSNLEQAKPLLAELSTLITSNSTSPRINELISLLKRIIFLLPCNDPLNKNKNDQELISSRHFHELCILHSIQTKNISGFESAINYLRVYYDNYPQLPVSQERNQIVALNLLYLLSFNKNTEYHSALELVGIEDIQNNKYIHFVTDLEKQLAIGNYSEVLLSKDKSPLPQFHLFLDRIFETIRFEIARSAERAYNHLLVNDAVKLFTLQSVDQLRTFVAEQSKHAEEQGYSWTLDNSKLVFSHKSSNKQALFNSENLISTALSYANEIEKIV